MRGVLVVVLLLAGSYAVLCVLALLFQKRLTFFPERRLEATPAAIGLEFEEVCLETEDGVRIHGWFVPAANPRGALVFCHGNAGNISHRLDSIRLFNGLGLATLAFDYRGYGRSDGDISEAGTYADARAAWRHLVEKRGFPADRVLVFGRSLGAAVAIELAAGVKPAGVIAESAFTSMADMASHAYPWLPTRWLLRLRYDSVARVREMPTPKLFVHSPQDDVAPFRLGRRLFDLAAEPKSFLEIRGSHNEGWMQSGPQYVDGLRRFLDSILRPGGADRSASPDRR
ncbi:MAG: alpha/beta hydrolase [Candidatus Krumholzibacteriia bacterium]